MICDIVTEKLLSIMYLIDIEKYRRKLNMKIRLENKLQNYMNENGHKDLVVYVTACNT